MNHLLKETVPQLTACRKPLCETLANTEHTKEKRMPNHAAFVPSEYFNVSFPFIVGKREKTFSSISLSFHIFIIEMIFKEHITNLITILWHLVVPFLFLFLTVKRRMLILQLLLEKPNRLCYL